MEQLVPVRIWDKLDDEPVEAFEAFLDYLDCGSKRTVDKAYQAKYGAEAKAPSSYRKWCRRFEWRDRAKNYEGFIESQAQQKIELAAVDDRTKIRMKQLYRSQQAQDILFGLLDKVKGITDEDKILSNLEVITNNLVKMMELEQNLVGITEGKEASPPKSEHNVNILVNAIDQLGREQFAHSGLPTDLPAGSSSLTQISADSVLSLERDAEDSDQGSPVGTSSGQSHPDGDPEGHIQPDRPRPARQNLGAEGTTAGE